MRISELKQPYRRMAEYLAEKNEDDIFACKEFISTAFLWWKTNTLFWQDINYGYYPEITTEIKKHFPVDFDFSWDEIKTKPVIQMLDAETQKAIYTQLAKQGKFDQLPDTCEFSEPVELVVWDVTKTNIVNKVVGKFKGLFISLAESLSSQELFTWKFAQLPTQKIYFSRFKTGDVVEVEDNEEAIFLDPSKKGVSFSKYKKYIKSITKIK